jgi:hypothetical protein
MKIHKNAQNKIDLWRLTIWTKAMDEGYGLGIYDPSKNRSRITVS